MKKVLLFVSYLLAVAGLQAQTAMGQWSTHFAYNSVTDLTQSGTRVYGLSDGALYSVDKRDQSVEYYSKMSGLNGTNISAIQYDKQNQCLILAYANGNIDLMTDGGVENISEFYTKQMTSDKSANSIYCYGGKAYLCCKFGIVVVNVKKREIAETYYIGPNAQEVNVQNLTVCDSMLYAATPTAVYCASISSPNLMNFENWHAMDGLPGSGDIQGIASLNNHLWLRRNYQVYMRQAPDSAWTQPLLDWGVYGMMGTDKAITFGHGSFMSVTTDGINCEQKWGLQNAMGIEVINLLKDGSDYWFAAKSNGLVVLHGDNTYNKYAPNGPITNSAYFMKFFGDVLYATNGHYFAVKSETPSNVLIYRNGMWEGISQAKIMADCATKDPQFLTTNPSNTNPGPAEANDADGVAVDPLDANHFYVTSLGSGMYEYRYQNGQYVIQNYYAAPNHDGEKVEVAADININLYKYSWTDAPVYDAQGNLFFSNLLAHYPIKVIPAGATESTAWINYTNATLLKGQRLFNFFFDRNYPQLLWYCDKRTNAGIGVINTNNTPYVTTDDHIRFFHELVDQNNTKWTITEVYCATQDQNGDIWLATDLGPLIIEHGQDWFNSSTITCKRVIIPREDDSGLGDYLLDGVKINCIVVDGGNRKWVGTDNNGLYLFEEDGTLEKYHFTTANSPLVSNSILSMAMSSNGELFIGTGNGIVSYQSDASDASDDMGDVYAYPNPVRPDYQGLITIKGTVDDAAVRITDAVGNLVCLTHSNGGTAVWDGKNGAGHRVGSGIYYALCVNEDGSIKGRTRILVLK